jgi:hypothetical protein
VEKLYEIIMLLKVWFKQVKKWNTEVSSLLIDGNCSSLEKYCEKEQFFTQKIEHPHNDITCRCHRVLDNRHHHPSVFMVLAFIVYNQIKEEHLSEPMMKVSICSHEHRINEVNCEEGLIIKGQTQFNVLLRVLKEYARKELDLCQKQLQQQQQQRKIRQAVYDHDKVETIVWTVNKSVENDNFGGKQCFVCKKVFSSKNFLKHHLANTLCIKRFKCQLCPAQYKGKYYWKTHLERIHGIISNASIAT